MARGDLQGWLRPTRTPWAAQDASHIFPRVVATCFVQCKAKSCGDCPEPPLTSLLCSLYVLEPEPWLPELGVGSMSAASSVQCELGRGRKWISKDVCNMSQVCVLHHPKMYSATVPKIHQLLHASQLAGMSQRQQTNKQTKHLKTVCSPETESCSVCGYGQPGSETTQLALRLMLHRLCAIQFDAGDIA